MTIRNKLFTFLVMFTLLFGIIFNTAIPVYASTAKITESDYNFFVSPKTQQEVDKILDQLEEDLTK